jgi:hypothetical protein
MLTPLRILHVEGLAFLYGLAAVIGYQLLTGHINLRGILQRKNGSGQSSPERIQLLIATIAAAARYVADVAQAPPGTMPDIPSNWLYLMGGSSGIYALRKAWNMMNRNGN